MPRHYPMLREARARTGIAPGIVLQLILIPVLVAALEKAGAIPVRARASRSMG